MAVSSNPARAACQHLSPAGSGAYPASRLAAAQTSGCFSSRSPDASGPTKALSPLSWSARIFLQQLGR